VRDATVTALEFAGYAVRSADNGQSALLSIDEQPPSLVLLDMRMPVMDGRELVRELRSRGFDLPIVVVTTRADAEETAHEVGAVGFIGKPFNFDELLAAVSAFRVPA
jgi:DNA-binding response OmpR family regulator